jgi:hypothetical protein
MKRKGHSLCEEEAAYTQPKKGRGRRPNKHDYEEEIQPQDFIVERIVDKAIINDAPYYQIKWLGFDERENTWVKCL